jgi:hypothetical protein
VSDFYSDAALKAAQALEADLAQAKADLEVARANGDDTSAGFYVSKIADASASLQNLNNLYAQYVQSQQPVPVRPRTQEDLLNKPNSELDHWDGLEIARQSRYGKDLTLPDLYQAVRNNRR